MIATATPAHTLIAATLARALRPRVPITVSEWADANRILSKTGSAEPGRWKTSRTPYLREIMDCLSEHHPAQLVAFMKASQTAGTEAGVNWLGYIIGHAGGPVAVVMPTEKSLIDWLAQKFEPMAQDTPAVAGEIAPRSNRAADNNQQRKKFRRGILYAKTAGSTAELKSTSLRYALADEIDEWDWTTIQGDPFGLLKVRTTTYHDRKIYVPSSPTLKEASRIEELFLAGDQQRYHCPCPHCGHFQVLQWGNLRWQPPAANRHHVEAAWYVCAECGGEIHEHAKGQMLARGQWIAQNPGAPYPSFHINAIYSPTGLGLSWAELASEWIEAQDDPPKLMRFINTRLGETWADRSRDIKANALIARAEPYPLRSLPGGVLVLTCGVDVQDDRLEVGLWGHGFDAAARTRLRWAIDHHVINGRPSEPEPWEALAAYLGARFDLGNGRSIPIEATGIDIGGHHTQAVYQFVRSRRAPRCVALKGATTPGKPVLGKPSWQDVNWKGLSVKKGVALYLVGTDTAKHQLYGLLDGDADKAPPDRRVRFSAELPERWFDGLVAEAFNPRKNRWEIKKGKRNEPLDCHVYAEAASQHPELYLHKWRAIDWQRRARMLGIDPDALVAAGPAPASERATPAATSPAPAAAQKPARGKLARRGRLLGGPRW